DHDIVEKLDASGLRIDRHHGGVGGVGEGPAVALGAIAGGDLEAAGVDVGRQVLRLQVPGAPDVAHADLRGARGHVALLHDGRGRVGLQEPGADAAGAGGQQAGGARDGATAHHHRARAPGGGRIGRVERVALEDLDAPEIDAEDLVGDLGV